jgi:ferrochelatase
MIDETKKTIGVLLMAYGGPNSIEEIPGYLADIRSGRPTPLKIIEEITSNYRSIGGRSPLLECTLKQLRALETHFDPSEFRFYLGMRHWNPWIEDIVRDMLDDGLSHAISLVLTPHYSKLSVAKYQSKIKSGLDMYRGEIHFEHIQSYHDHPGLIQAFANRVDEGLNLWQPEERESVHVVFSAHSLPVRIIKMGDPYKDQLLETANLVAEQTRLETNRWSWSFQSAGQSPEAWLGPQIPEHLENLAQKGIKNVLVVPVGFVSDHVEILFDIDIQAKEIAGGLGIKLERPPALNDDPIFIQTLADIIQEHARNLGWI